MNVHKGVVNLLVESKSGVFYKLTISGEHSTNAMGGKSGSKWAGDGFIWRLYKVVNGVESIAEVKSWAGSYRTAMRHAAWWLGER